MKKLLIAFSLVGLLFLSACDAGDDGQENTANPTYQNSVNTHQK